MCRSILVSRPRDPQQNPRAFPGTSPIIYAPYPSHGSPDAAGDTTPFLADVARHADRRRGRHRRRHGPADRAVPDGCHRQSDTDARPGRRLGDDQRPAPTGATAPATAAPTASASSASASVADAPVAGTNGADTTSAAFEDRPVNLLASENGGQLVATSSDEWLGTIDGKEVFNQISYGVAQQNFAVFGFEDEKPARFDLFTLLVPATQDTNVKEFELLVGNDSPTGRFSSIGTFTTQNLKLMRTPFQEFRFPAVTAKYLKVRLVSSYGYPHPDVREIRLFGVRAR